MKYKAFAGYLFLFILISYGLFAFFYNEYSKRALIQGMKRHAVIIENDVWTLETNHTTTYLDLVANSDNYAQIIIKGLPGDELLSIKGPKLMGLDLIFDQMGLFPISVITADIKHDGQVIAQLYGRHRNINVYIYFYVFLFLVLTYFVIMLYFKTIDSNRQIQLKVREQTADLRNEIADRKKIEENLKQKQFYLTKAQELGQIGTWELDLVQNKLVWTDENCRIFGVSFGSVVNYEVFLEKVHPEDREYVDREWNEALQGKSYDLEHRILVDGKQKWVREKADIEFDEAGNAVKAIGFTQDITKRKESDKNLARLTIAIEQTAEVIVITNTDGTIQYVNPAFTFITGYSLEEAVGQNPRVLKSGEHPDLFYEQLWNTILQGEVWRGHFVNKKKDGSLYDEEATISPVINATGDITNFVAVKRDVTQELRKEEQLQQSQKMEAVGTLAGGIAHDFNNILGGIVGYAELAQDDLSTNNPVQEYIGGILKSSTRAKDLVKQILTFSRKSQGSRKPILVYPIIKEVAKLLRSTTPVTIEMKLNIDESSGMVNADPTQIHQIMMNLCTNAVHSMQETGGVLGIDLSCIDLKDKSIEGFHDLEPGPFIMLKISDTGSGIDSSNLPRIFEPFFTTKTEEKGTGMGLSVVHGIIKSYGGNIVVKSQIGQGSTFTVLLPQILAEHKKEEDIAVAIPKGTECILLVDDEKALLDIGKKMLQSLGYTVIDCNNSLEALEIFEQQPSKFDLVVTDQTMPHMTGYELANRILEIKPAVPVILCTGYSDTVSSERAEALGIKAFIYKPISKKEIAGTIREVLDKHNQT